jgi:hypothetical protein
VLRLDPAGMEDPDLEVRSDIEKALRGAYDGVEFSDDGYGFARNSEAMMLSYATNDPERLVAALVDIVEHHPVRGNRLARAAMIGVADRDEDPAPGEEFSNHRLAYPSDALGEPLPD